MLNVLCVCVWACVCVYDCLCESLHTVIACIALVIFLTELLVILWLFFFFCCFFLSVFVWVRLYLVALRGALGLSMALLHRFLFRSLLSWMTLRSGSVLMWWELFTLISLFLFLPSHSTAISCNPTHVCGFPNFIYVLGSRSVILTQSAVKLALRLYSYHCYFFLIRENRFIAMGSKVVCHLACLCVLKS